MLLVAFPDVPLSLPVWTGRIVLIAAPAFATLGAVWRAPAAWFVYVAPGLVPALAVLFARVALDAPSMFAGLADVPDDRVLARLVPLAFLSLPGAIAGAVVGAASRER